MAISRRSANIMVAGLLGLAVLGAGIIGYSAKIQADSITPGFATARVIMGITVPKQTEISITATFNPVDSQAKRYFFKNRVFVLKPGINLVNWYIKKIPEDSYNVTIKSNLANFQPEAMQLALISDKITDTNKFVIDMGMPPVLTEDEMPEPTDTIPTATATTKTTTKSPSSPPVPSLDMTATTSATPVATERIPTESIPSIPQLST